MLALAQAASAEAESIRLIVPDETGAFRPAGVHFYAVMEFGFDVSKSAANLAKHGLDFHAAQRLWNDPDALLVAARNGGEVRKLLVAKFDGKLWSAVFTERGGRTRIISLRRARTSEATLYEQNDGGES
jgi:hypothetical protein